LLAPASDSGQESQGMLTIAVEDPDQPDIRAFLAAAEATSAALHPAAGGQPAPLRAPGVVLLVAREGGRARGMGALVPRDGHAEITRLWVDPGQRGRGIGAAQLQMLEAVAVAQGVAPLRLETGVAATAAQPHISRAGYALRGPSGGQPADPLRLVHEKRLC
jgi:putative acetyltransferase